MLFSSDAVAAFISNNFEPVWESVRPVPLLRLDFGNGTVVTRTLNGNIATHVCTPQGQVLDVLPGIYTATAYLEQLNQFRLLANYLAQTGDKSSEVRLADYHYARLTALKNKETPPYFVNLADRSKRVIEGGIKAMLVSKPGKTPQPVAEKESAPNLATKEDVGSWKELVRDTQVNETFRRLQIHEQLAKEGMIQPERLTKWLYREVLHADLDDPYLGLGKLLFDQYAFRAEENR